MILLKSFKTEDNNNGDIASAILFSKKSIIQNMVFTETNRERGS